MADTKKTGSKSNLNESTLPLLDTDKGGDQKDVNIELETKQEPSGDEPKNDKEGESWFDAEADVEAGNRRGRRLIFRGLFAGKKAKKEKKPKQPKPQSERKPRISPLTHAQVGYAPSCN